MNYSNADIEKVQELAEILTPISEIAALMNFDCDSLREDISRKHSEISKAYYRGKAKTALEFRKNEIELANAGSPLAVQMTKKYLNEMEDDAVL